MRRGLLCVLVITLVLSWALAAQALTVNGRVLDQAGNGVAGAIVSDEVNAVASKADGGFSLATRNDRVVSVTAPAGYAPPEKWWWRTELAAKSKINLRLQARQSSGPPLVALIADPHLFDEQGLPINFSVPDNMIQLPLQTWTRVAGEIKALSPTLTIVAGDLCADAEKGDLDHAKAQLNIAARAMAELPAPARAVPGNHDIRHLEGRVDRALWRQTFGPARQVFLLPGAAFILLDNTGLSQAIKGKPLECANLPDDALAWLRRVLVLIPSGYRLYVVSHYPLLSPITGSNPLFWRSLVRSQRDKGLALADADQSFGKIAGILAGRDLAAFIHGHEHAGNKTTVLARKPFQVIGLPAFCGGWWGGDRKWGAYKFPPAYALLRLKSAPQEPAFELEFIEVKY